MVFQDPSSPTVAPTFLTYRHLLNDSLSCSVSTNHDHDHLHHHQPRPSTPSKTIRAATAASPPCTATRMADTPKYRYRIRHAINADIPQLGGVERSAGESFRTVGLDAVADDEPMPAEVLRKYMDEGDLWVAVAVTSAEGEGEGDGASERGENGVKNAEYLMGLGPPAPAPATAAASPELRTQPQEMEKEEQMVVGFLACFPIFRNFGASLSRETSSLCAGREANRDIDGQEMAEVESKVERECETERDLETPATTTDYFLHIAELSVHSDHQKRGLGKRLLETMFMETSSTQQNQDYHQSQNQIEQQQQQLPRPLNSTDVAVSSSTSVPITTANSDQSPTPAGVTAAATADPGMLPTTQTQTLAQTPAQTRPQIQTQIQTTQPEELLVPPPPRTPSRPHNDDNQVQLQPPCQQSIPPAPSSPNFTRTCKLLGHTLTTYSHLPFNAPFYARMGFRVLPADEIENVVGTRGRELWDQEQRGGIMLPERRCWMIRDIEGR